MEINRRSGIGGIGDFSWGTHFCNVYLDINELIHYLVPYFKAGLTNNESCVWVMPKSFDTEEAKDILNKHIPDFGQYLSSGQIEILSYAKCYVIDGIFNKRKALEAWMKRINDALASGYDGLRVSGNADWIENKDWDEWMFYEKEVNKVIDGYKMIAACNYTLSHCTATQLNEAILAHQFSTFNINNSMRIVTNSNNSRKRLNDNH